MKTVSGIIILFGVNIYLSVAIGIFERDHERVHILILIILIIVAINKIYFKFIFLPMIRING